MGEEKKKGISFHYLQLVPAIKLPTVTISIDDMGESGRIGINVWIGFVI